MEYNYILKGIGAKTVKFDDIVDYYADFFYRRCEFVANKESRMLFSLAICSASTVMSDEITIGVGKYMMDKLLNEKEYVKKAYKLIAMYIIIKTNYQNSLRYTIKTEDAQKIFSMRALDIKYLKYFNALIHKGEGEFELEFAKYFARHILGTNSGSPINIALSVNILYNSYQRFLEDGSNYLRRKVIAI